jgi:protein involved in sex pheromone biosynthesis
MRKGDPYFFHFFHKLGPVFDILETYLWPVIARHFPTDEYLFQDGNAPVHASMERTHWKQEKLILPHNIADNAQLSRSPRHSGRQTSSGRLHT